MNTNRIKQALAEGKAVECKTEDEARQLFEVMGWTDREVYGNDLRYFWRDERSEDSWDASCIKEHHSCPKEVVPFSTLTRSRLAEALGVDDGQEFEYSTWSKKRFVIQRGGSAVADRTDYVREVETGLVAEGDTICEMLAHPEEITPCPVWSEDSIKAARAAELLGFSEVRRAPVNKAGVVWLSLIPDGHHINTKLFPEIPPGQTVKLSEIK